METIIKAAAGAAVGVVLGWAGTALTLVGKVGAIEKTLDRIELRLDQIQGVKR